MKKTLLTVAVLGAISSMTASPVRADELSDLKAEIAAQRAQAEAQRLRLDALEKKLEASTAQQRSVTTAGAAGAGDKAAPEPTPPAREGLTYQRGDDYVTLYGLLDITASHISNADSKGHSVTSYQTSWFSGNRWGLTGAHGLGNKSNVIFKLESEFILNTGEQDTAGVLFNRDAWIGFESEDYGKLTFGRQNALARDYSGIYGDPYGGAVVTLEEGGYTNTNNFKQLIFYAGSATGTRYDRGVVWKKKFGANWVAGLGYQFGGIPGDFPNGSTQTAAFGYNGTGFNLAGFYNHAQVATLSHQTYSIGGNVLLGPLVRLNAGYFHYRAEQAVVGDRTDNAYTLSAKFTPAGKLDYELGYQVLKAKNAGFGSSGNTLNPYANTSGVKLAGSGDKKTVYASAFYHFDRRTEVYLAADYLRLTSGYKVGVTNGFKNQTEVATGLRFRF